MSHNAEKAGRFKSKNKYLLSGLVHCGECGYSLQGNTRKDGRHGILYSSYDCSGRKRHNGCVSGGICKRDLDNFVLFELYDKVLSNVSINEITDRLNEYHEKMAAKSSGELETAMKELAETERKIARVVALATETDTSVDVFKAELQKLKNSKVFLESKINELRTSNTVAKIPVEVTADLLNRSREIIKSQDFAECRNVITAFVEKVVVYKDRVDVVFKVMVPDDEGNGGLSPIISEEAIETVRGNNFK
jgi:site-specific DNA recombinase